MLTRNEVMVKSKNCVFFTAVIAIQILNVMSVGLSENEDRSHCHKFPFISTDCIQACPKTFPGGRCLQFERKWQCLCGNGHKTYKLYTVKEAKKVYKVCNSKIQNDKGCKKLCPKHFYDGYCDKVQGIWQCFCNQKNRLFDYYTIPEAKNMGKVCNKKKQSKENCETLCPDGFAGHHCRKSDGFWICYCESREEVFGSPVFYTLPEAEALSTVSTFCNRHVQNDEMCKTLCPSIFEIGHCLKKNEIWECYCGQRNYQSELYTLGESKKIYEACYGVNHHQGNCSSLCPDGLKSGQCFEITKDIKGCGCKRMEHEKELYTLRKAYEMNSVCNSENHQKPEAKESCSNLCPQGFNNGKCDEASGLYECFCSRGTEEEESWITLKEAIAFKQKQKEGKRKGSRFYRRRVVSGLHLHHESPVQDQHIINDNATGEEGEQ